MTEPTITTFAERPELIDQIYSMTQVWPEFISTIRARALFSHLEPELPMIEYSRQLRPDGLPVDPWLRVHVRAGGEVEKVAPVSMVIAGSLAQWRVRTDLPFDTAGPVLVPLALVPVYCDLENDYAVLCRVQRVGAAPAEGMKTAWHE